MSTIDFTKVDAAFGHLSNDPKGQAQLAEFGDALNRLKKALPNVNENEAHYIASSLLQQTVGVQSNIATGGVKKVSGFLIKTAVKAD